MNQLYCSEITKEHNLDPCGSASFKPLSVFIKIAKPWPKNILFDDRVKALSQLLETHFPKHIPILIDDEKIDQSSLEIFSLTFNNQKPKLNSFEFQNNQLIKTQNNKQHIFICTHSERDNCCGIFGQKLYNESKKLESKTLHIWQCSHLGGHRFAPTFIDSKTGCMWGLVDNFENFKEILSNKAENSIFKKLRGMLWEKDPTTQLAHRELFKIYGYSYLEKNISIIKQNHLITIDCDNEKHEFEIKETTTLELQASCSESTPQTTKQWMIMHRS